MTIKICIFSILAVLIFVKFRTELLSFMTHGFYVFFAFEALLLLLFFNIDFLIVSVFSWHQILSWMFLLVSALIALMGFYGLKKYGKPAEGWEETTHLIKQGIFRYIRHPLYSSLILLAIGILLKDLTLQSTAACLVSVVFLVAASVVEEKENLLKFGEAYSRYMNGRKRYIPLIF